MQHYLAWLYSYSIWIGMVLLLEYTTVLLILLLSIILPVDQYTPMSMGKANADNKEAISEPLAALKRRRCWTKSRTGSRR